MPTVPSQPPASDRGTISQLRAQLDALRRRLAYLERADTERKEAEKALELSEARFRFVIEQMPAVLWATDIHLTITMSLGGGLIGLGLKPNQVVGMSLVDYLRSTNPDYPPLAMHLRALKGESVSTTLTFQERTFLSHLEPLTEADGTISGIIGVALDITERRRAEERFRSQYQGLPVPTYTWQKVNDGFRLIDYNAAAEAITKGLIPTLLGVDAGTLYAQDPDVLADITRCFDEKTTVRRQIRYRFKTTGDEKDLAVSYVYLPPDLVMIHTEDVTERLRAETDLRETHDMLQSLIRASPLAIMTLDRSDRVTSWNPAAERMFGWLESEVLRRPLPFITDENRDDYSHIRQADLRGESQAEYEALLQRKDGSSVSISLWTAPVKDAHGAVAHTIGIVADTTERKQDERKLQENAERLLALSRRLLEVQELERRHLATELHDEIGQSLTGLGMMLQLLIEDAGIQRIESLERARELTKELTAKVRDLSLRLRPTMLDDLGLLPAIFWHVDRFLEQTKIHVTVQHRGLDRRLNPRSVETAAFRIVQEALTNVARHARVHSAIVRVHLTQDKIRVQIEDDGVGFDVNARAAGASSSGLSGMRERAVLLGGTLTIDSKIGRGTRVTAEIPIQGLEERRRNAFEPVTGG